MTKARSFVINPNTSNHAESVAMVSDGPSLEPRPRAGQICGRQNTIVTFPELLFSLLCNGGPNDTWLTGPI